MLDAQGQVAVNKVLPSDYPLIGAMLYISTIVPLVVTAALLARLWFSARDYLSRFREKRYVQEHTSTVLNRAFTITKEEVEEPWDRKVKSSHTHGRLSRQDSQHIYRLVSPNFIQSLEHPTATAISLFLSKIPGTSR